MPSIMTIRTISTIAARCDIGRCDIGHGVGGRDFPPDDGGAMDERPGAIQATTDRVGNRDPSLLGGIR
jgi:hypothetical protein